MPAEREIGTLQAVGPLGYPPGSKYDRLIATAVSVPAAKTVVPCDGTSLQGATEAAKAGILVPILVGPAAKILSVAGAHNLEIGHTRLSTCRTSMQRRQGVLSSSMNPGELLTKGSLHTDELTREVTSGTSGQDWLAYRISHTSDSRTTSFVGLCAGGVPRAGWIRSSAPSRSHARR